MATPERAAAAKSAAHEAAIKGDVLRESHLAIGHRYGGKVRDVYTSPNKIAIVTSDRLSAFDRLLACVPFKGAVLNMTSAWWFNNTRHILPNHLLATPHPNVAIVKRCKPFMVEMVVRSYLTGTTSTSIWVHYQQGSRNYCGHALPEGMKKNQKLPYNMVTPTTKEETHDRPISGLEVVDMGLMTKAEWEYVQEKALALFAFGQETAAKRGLILVDTKYEFGRDASTGEIMIIDEMHTPDSSRYWLADSYEQRLAEGKEPDNIDKEFLRIWFRSNCDPYADAKLPQAPVDLVAELSSRYVKLYELITGEVFVPGAKPDVLAITAAIAPHLQAAKRVVAFVDTDGASHHELVGRAVCKADATLLATEYHSLDIASGSARLLELYEFWNSLPAKVVVAVTGSKYAAATAANASVTGKLAAATFGPNEQFADADALINFVERL